MGKSKEEVLGGLGEGGEGSGEGSDGSFPSDSESQILSLTFSMVYLQATLDKNFDEHVASVPTAVCNQLESLERKRREELTELEGQVDTLLRDSRNLHSG